MMEPTLTNMAPRQNDVQADELAILLSCPPTLLNLSALPPMLTCAHLSPAPISECPEIHLFQREKSGATCENAAPRLFGVT